MTLKIQASQVVIDAFRPTTPAGRPLPVGVLMLLAIIDFAKVLQTREPHDSNPIY